MTNISGERRVIRTDDGSLSIYADMFKASYHSTHGALTESEHVFVKAGLAHVTIHKREVSVLECGFGTGLNLFASLAYAATAGATLDYHGVEAHPLPSDLLASTDYSALPALKPLVGLSPKLIDVVHDAPWPSITTLDGLGVLRKRLQTFQSIDDLEAFDLVYYDAFAPGSQPELWRPSVFERLYRALHPGGVLVTYCVRGQVRRDLMSIGFDVVKLPGPPGKREMTRATKLG